MNTELIEAVRAIDPEAAEWLMRNHEQDGDVDMRAKRLKGCVVFDDTPQGFDYWLRILSQLPAHLR